MLFVLLALPSLVSGQENSKAKPPTWLHGLEFSVRKGGEAEFGPMTKAFGLEVFRDENNGNLIYVTETGAVAQAPPVANLPNAKVKPPSGPRGIELHVRKSGDADFTKETKRIGVEIFKDENADYVVFISETGDITQASAAGVVLEGKAQVPTWLYGLAAPARKGGEADFTKDTKKYGLEVFKDDNTSNWIYLSETGSIARAPAGTKPDAGKAKGATWIHGLEFRVRKAGEQDFTKDTRKFGVEVFRDENTGNFLYLSETGSIAVVPGKPPAADSKTKAPTWLHAMEFRVRKAGEADFGAATKKWGVEVFRDENNGNLVYISETGAITVAPAK
jgi:hypothetical protein